jgi:tRNA_anti-like
MAKTCPSCGYRPIGPFTDNCPMCAEPVRNVRSDAARSRLIANMPPMLKWVLGGAVAVVLGVAGCCGLGMWKMGRVIENAQKEAERMQAEREAERKARTVVVTAADLLQDFQTDRDAADQKYAGKYLEISGVVERHGHGRGRYDAPFVVLHGGDENAKFKIECFFDLFDPRDDAGIKRLRKGQTITVRGEYDGQVSNVQLKECVLVK